MGKIYHFSRVEDKIQAIVVNQDASTGVKTESPTYKQSISDPRYKKATIVGILLSAF